MGCYCVRASMWLRDMLKALSRWRSLPWGPSKRANRVDSLAGWRAGVGFRYNCAPVMNKLAISLTALVLGGCSTVWLPVYSVEVDTDQVPGVVVRSETLQGVLRVGTPSLDLLAGSGGQVVLGLPVRNIDIEPIRVVAELRFLAADSQGVREHKQRAVMELPSMEVRELRVVSAVTGVFGFEARFTWDT